MSKDSVRTGPRQRAGCGPAPLLFFPCRTACYIIVLIQTGCRFGDSRTRGRIVYKNLGLLFFAGVLIAAGVAVYRSIKSAANDTTPGPLDVSLEKLRTRNPGLAFSPVGDRAHAFWVTDPGSGRTVLVPWQQSEDAVIEFLSCTPSDIPEQLLYPRRSSEPVCLRLANEDGILSAYFFLSPDSLYDAVTFYDGPSNNHGIRGTCHEQTGREGTRPDGTSGFLYSYFFYRNDGGSTVPRGLVGFVGYKKEKRAR